ncbi:MAG: hypothetical protein NT003_03865 [Candidatus Magasanikbacteria bacterium]|nr:hypothetical protein [Candidatus Magasanikbacteria bacterium]
MYQNPFSELITPAAETDPIQNQDLIRALLGEETAEEFAGLVSDQPKTMRQPRPNLKALADAALGAQPDLIASASEKRAEQFLRDELKIKFQQQAESLTAMRFLKVNQNGELGNFDNSLGFYPLPTPEQVVAHFTAPEKIEFYKRKVEQGFTRVLITPFATPLESFVGQTARLIKRQKAAGMLRAQDGTRLELYESKPVWVWVKLQNGDHSEELVYNVTEFDWEHHEGKTKSQLLADSTQPFPGFHIQLLQEDLTVPREGSGTTIKDRQVIESGKTAETYFDILQNNRIYFGEHGLTPEDWLTLFATTLHETGIAIDDCADGINSATYLTGCYLPASRTVPIAYWSRRDGNANLNVSGSVQLGSNNGLRTAVS